jgi:DNA-binding CsgD family transcriptional regulator
MTPDDRRTTTRRGRSEIADREVRALELRRSGATYDQIADRLNISEAGARKIVKRVLERHTQEAAGDVRKLEADRLDMLQVTALNVLRRQHYVVSGGKVVYNTPGEGQASVPLVDDGPTLAAIRTLVTIQERRAKLLGLDAPTKVNVRVQTIDELDAEIAELEAELATNDSQPQPTSDA